MQAKNFPLQQLPFRQLCYKFDEENLDFAFCEQAVRKNLIQYEFEGNKKHFQAKIIALLFKCRNSIDEDFKHCIVKKNYKESFYDCSDKETLRAAKAAEFRKRMQAHVCQRQMLDDYDLQALQNM